MRDHLTKTFAASRTTSRRAEEATIGTVGLCQLFYDLVDCRIKSRFGRLQCLAS